MATEPQPKELTAKDEKSQRTQGRVQIGQKRPTSNVQHPILNNPIALQLNGLKAQNIITQGNALGK